jgi:hypothetical protein
MAPDVPVLDFNPWQWGDGDAIARALFTQMAGKLGGSHSPGATRRARAMRTYGGLLVGGAGKLDKLGYNATGVASLLGGAAVVAAIVGVTVPGVSAATMSVAILVWTRSNDGRARRCSRGRPGAPGGALSPSGRFRR